MKVGVIGLVTVMFIDVVVAHCPAVGVKVYVDVPALAVLTAGDQDPLMLLVDVVGSVGGVEPWQTGPTALNVGVVGAFTVRLIVVVVAHCPAVGVNV